MALASLELLTSRGWAGDVARVSDGLRTGLAPLRDAAGVVDVRVLGAVGAVQLDHAVDVPRATQAALDAGVWLRPFRDLVYVMPPYVTSPADVALICEGVAEAVAVG